MELTNEHKIMLIKSRLQWVCHALENPFLQKEAERSLLLQLDTLESLLIRIDLDDFVADLGYGHDWGAL